MVSFNSPKQDVVFNFNETQSHAIGTSPEFNQNRVENKVDFKSVVTKVN